MNALVGRDAIGEAGGRLASAPLRLPDWPRLMNADLAAAYVGIGRETLRLHGPAPKRDPDRIGRRVLYDRRDLDRWADALGGGAAGMLEPTGPTADDVESAWFDRRDRKG